MRQYQKMEWIAHANVKWEVKCDLSSLVHCVPHSLPFTVCQVCAWRCFFSSFFESDFFLASSARMHNREDPIRRRHRELPCMGTWSCKLHKRLIMWRDFFSLISCGCAMCANEPTTHRMTQNRANKLEFDGQRRCGFLLYRFCVSFMGCHGCFVCQLNLRAFAFNLMCQIGQK